MTDLSKIEHVATVKKVQPATSLYPAYRAVCKCGWQHPRLKDGTDRV